MSNGIYTALSGSIARQVQLDALSHNLANADTIGYKSQRVLFEKTMVDAVNGNQQVEVAGLAPNYSGGALEESEYNLDLALIGEGFFVLESGEEVLLTRNGMFDINADGYLVNQDGLRVLDNAGRPVQLFTEPDYVLVAPGGAVWDEEGVVANLAVVTTQDPALVQAMGQGTLSTPQSNLLPVENPEVAQGFLEKSNVEMVRGMTEMITLHRYFEAMQKLVTQHHEMDRKVIQSVGGNN